MCNHPGIAITSIIKDSIDHKHRLNWYNTSSIGYLIKRDFFDDQLFEFQLLKYKKDGVNKIRAVKYKARKKAIVYL